MPNQNSDDEAKLQKLGKRLREGWAKKHPMPEKSVQTVRDAVREQWECEQAQKKAKPSPGRPKSQERKPQEPDQDR